MAASDIQDGRLVELYHRYVGEPDSKRDVYGYWLFLIGTLAGVLGFVIYEAAFEFHERNGGWIWRLVDENGRSLAESVEPHASRQAAREDMRTVKDRGPSGETVVTW